MARLHFVKTARKDYPEQGIKKGESYYHWKFKRGPLLRSKTRPRRSRLTQSSFYSAMWDAEDDLSDAADEFTNKKISLDDFVGACEEAANRVREAGDDCQSKYDNMPSSLQQGDTGQLLERRVESCETIATALEEIAKDLEHDAESLKAEDGIDGQALLENVSWDYD